MRLASTGTSIGVDETDPAAIMIPRAANGIGDLVWNDENGDGIQDAGEVGRNGMVVELYSSTGSLLETVTTQFLDNNTGDPGHYWFGDLAPGDYYLKFAAPPIGLNAVPADIGDDTLDSDADPATMLTGVISIGATDIELSVDAGYFVPGGPSNCVAPTAVFDPTQTNNDRRQVNDARPCPG